MPSFLAYDWIIRFQSYQVIENCVIGSVERGNERFSSLWFKKKKKKKRHTPSLSVRFESFLAFCLERQTGFACTLVHVNLRLHRRPSEQLHSRRYK